MSQNNLKNITEKKLAPLKVYWQPGCSSCLKTKEFLLEHGVAFQSVNVLEDEAGFEELQALGLKLVPIVARGKNWANGAVFRDVAKVAGFKYDGHKMHSLLNTNDADDDLLRVDLGGRRIIK